MGENRSSEIDLVVIAAIAENGVIGRDGGMPWHYPADLEHFKETTMGHPVILGRRTYESIADRIGGPLPGRTNIVLTRAGMDAPDDVVVANSVDEAIDAASEAVEDAASQATDETDSDPAYVAGGAAVYEQVLPRADRMVITELPDAHEGDTYFPEWDRDDWVEIERETVDDLAFVTYERR